MRALRLHTRGGPDQLVCESAPTPEPGTGDALVEVHAASYTPGELQWPSTWIDRSGHDRTPIIPCYELSGVISGLGFGATGVSVGDGDTLVVLGAGGGVGNLAVQLAHHVGARVLGVGRAKHRAAILEAGASEFVDPDHEPLPNLTETSLALDTVGGPLARSVAAALGSSGRFVSIVDPAIPELVGSRGTFFVVEPDRDGLNEIASRVDERSLTPVLGRQADLSDAPNPPRRQGTRPRNRQGVHQAPLTTAR